VNFVAILLIFHDFLARSLSQLLHHPIDALQAAILGFVAYYVCFYAIDWVVSLILPGYTNYNDESIAALSRGNYFLMFIGTVILVPPVEECLYRGLIFRNLYKKSHWAAYVISIAAFACLHILGYIGTYSARDLIIAFIQYLPAGLWLAWSYIKGESIFVPILIHAAVNFITIRGIL
jgi:membrane protease YdiL (CAAX protease family)